MESTPPRLNLRASKPRPNLAAICLLVSSAVVAFGTTIAQAEELRLGIEGTYTYNSNFFSAANNQDAANSFQIGPSIQIDDPDGRFRYEIDFNGAYQIYADQSGVDAWESRLRARATYDLTTRTRVRVTERFRDISNLRFSRQDIALLDTALDPNQDRYFRNDLELELIHDFTELLEGRVRGEHHWIDFEQNNDRNDSQSFDVAGELRYQLATRHFVGAGVSYTRQDFDQALSRLGSIGEYVSGYANWTWLVTDNITFTANGGPAWVRSEEENESSVSQTQFVGGRAGGQLFQADIGSCGAPARASLCDFATPGFPPIAAGDLGALQTFALPAGNRAGTQEELTFFGGASISAEFAAWNLQASYQRRQSTTSGDGLASSLDRVAAEIEWAPAKYRFSLFLAGSWDRRETLTRSTNVDFALVPSAPGTPAQRATAITSVRTSDTTRDNYTLIGGYRYRLEENFAATLDGRYRRTEIDDPTRSQPGIDTAFFVITFEYTLDPIAF